jgi:hypothetical protein
MVYCSMFNVNEAGNDSTTQYLMHNQIYKCIKQRLITSLILFVGQGLLDAPNYIPEVHLSRLFRDLSHSLIYLGKEFLLVGNILLQ